MEQLINITRVNIKQQWLDFYDICNKKVLIHKIN